MFNKDRKPGRDRHRDGDRRGPRDRREHHERPEREANEQESAKVKALVEQVINEIGDSLEPASLTGLNAFERKLVHRQCDHTPDLVTKTYRKGEDYELKIYPVGNIRKFAQSKADEAIQSRKKVVLPHMSSYQRFVIHDALKNMETVKAESFGEGEERHIEIIPEAYGRGLKRIIKKIKLI